MTQKTTESVEDEIIDAFKGAAVALVVVASIPIFIPTAACVLAYSEIKEKFKRCPVCASRRLIFKGVESTNIDGCIKFRTQNYLCRRRPPVYSFFECADCSGKYKKLYGGPLLDATDEEFDNMSANSF